MNHAQMSDAVLHHSFDFLPHPHSWESRVPAPFVAGGASHPQVFAPPRWDLHPHLFDHSSSHHLHPDFQIRNQSDISHHQSWGSCDNSLADFSPGNVSTPSPIYVSEGICSPHDFGFHSDLPINPSHDKFEHFSPFGFSETAHDVSSPSGFSIFAHGVSISADSYVCDDSTSYNDYDNVYAIEHVYDNDIPVDADSYVCNEGDAYDILYAMDHGYDIDPSDNVYADDQHFAHGASISDDSSSGDTFDIMYAMDHGYAIDNVYDIDQHFSHGVPSADNVFDNDHHFAADFSDCVPISAVSDHGYANETAAVPVSDHGPAAFAVIAADIANESAIAFSAAIPADLSAANVTTAYSSDHAISFPNCSIADLPSKSAIAAHVDFATSIPLSDAFPAAVCAAIDVAIDAIIEDVLSGIEYHMPDYSATVTAATLPGKGSFVADLALNHDNPSASAVSFDDLFVVLADAAASPLVAPPVPAFYPAAMVSAIVYEHGVPTFVAPFSAAAPLAICHPAGYAGDQKSDVTSHARMCGSLYANETAIFVGFSPVSDAVTAAVDFVISAISYVADALFAVSGAPFPAVLDSFAGCSPANLIGKSMSKREIRWCPPFPFSAKYYHEDGGSCVRQSSFFEGKAVLNQGVGYSVILGFGVFFLSLHLFCSIIKTKMHVKMKIQ